MNNSAVKYFAIPGVLPFMSFALLSFASDIQSDSYIMKYYG